MNIGEPGIKNNNKNKNSPIPRFLHSLSTLSMAMYPRRALALCIDCLQMITPIGLAASWGWSRAGSGKAYNGGGEIRSDMSPRDREKYEETAAVSPPQNASRQGRLLGRLSEGRARPCGLGKPRTRTKKERFGLERACQETIANAERNDGHERGGGGGKRLTR